MFMEMDLKGCNENANTQMTNIGDIWDQWFAIFIVGFSVHKAYVLLSLEVSESSVRAEPTAPYSFISLQNIAT